VSNLFFELEKNCNSAFITLPAPYISLVVVLSELAYDDGVDVDSGKESIQKIVPILYIKIATEKYSKDSIHFLYLSLYDQFY
jgi:hypothetical protein